MKLKSRPIFAASSALVIHVGVSATALHAADWLSTGTTDWNTASNWNTNRVPIKTGFNDAAIINTNSGSIATISASISATPTDIIVGNGGGSNGRVDHTAGTAQSGAGNWIKVGNNGGSGVYNLANTSTTGAGITGFAQGSGSLASGGHLRVGAGDNGTGNTGTFNMHTTGTLSATQLHVGATSGSNGRFNLESGAVTSGDVYIGNGNAGGSGRLDIAGGSLASTAWVKIGHNGGVGIINLANTGGTGGTLTGFAQGSGSMSMTGNFRLGGGDAGSGGNGTFNMNTSGSLTVSQPFDVGTQASTGVMNLDSGTVNANDLLYIGNAASSNGTINISGGTINKPNAGAFSVGAGGTGALNQSGGTISINGEFWVGSTSNGTYTMSGGSLTNNNWFVVGRNGNGTGTLNMTGGTITKNGGGDLVVGADSGTANGTILFSGGLIDVTSGLTNIGKGGGIGTLTISGTAEFRTSQMILGVGSGTGTANLNGGTIKTSAFIRGTGTGNAYFNGTLLQATADNPTFITGLGTAEIQSGGLKIDSNGKDLGSPQAFSGSGNIIKSGSGTLSLTGSSVFHTGNVVVNGGTLAINDVGAGGVDFTIADGTALKCISTNGFNTRTLGTLTMGTTGATQLNFDLGNVPGNPSFAPMAAGSLVINGSVTLNLADLDISLGTVPLLEYSAKSGSGSITLGSLPTGVTAELLDNNAGLIYLNVTSLALPRWDATLSDVWDTTTFNWLNAGFPSNYTNGSTTQFDDTVGGPTLGAVVLNSTVTPISLTFDNSTVPYSLNGTGSISGSTGLTKRGFQSLELYTANEYTGVTDLQGGTTSINSLANAGSPSSIGAAAASPANLLLSGGNLVYTGTAATTDRGFTIGAANTTIQTTADIRFDGQVVSDPNSNLIKTGTGKLGFGGSTTKTIGTINKGLRILEGTVSFSGSAANNVASELWIGDPLSTANSALEVTNSNLTSGSWIAIGIGNGTTNLASSATFTNSTVTQNGGGVSLGYAADLGGYLASSSLTLNSSTLNTVNLEIGRSTGSTAEFTSNGNSTVNATGYLQIGIETGVATVTFKDNTVYNSGNYIHIGNSTGSTGTLNVQDSASVSFSGDQELRIGNSGQGTLNQTGGSVSANGWMAIGRSTGGNGTLNLSGGTFTQANSARFIHVGEDGNGTLNISGTGAFIANSTTGLLLGDLAASSGTVNLNGGSLTANAVLDNASGTTAFNFNGGLLKAGGAANATFMNGIDTVTVQAGGAIIDSNGANISINTPLLDGGTGGGLTKQGAGNLTLTGANTYAGGTSVNNGTLTLADNAQLRFVIGANGVNNSISGTGTLQLDGDFNIDISGANTTAGNSWTLVNVGTLAETYGASFNVPGFANNSGVWTMTSGGNEWTFTEATGILTVQAAASGYATWASANAGGQTADLDFDNDGVANGVEFFMGQTGSSFTANPPLVGNTVTWPKSAGFVGSYKVETSTDLVNWTDVTGSAVDNGTSVSYTLPTGNPKLFVHLVVTPN